MYIMLSNITEHQNHLHVHNSIAKESTNTYNVK